MINRFVCAILILQFSLHAAAQEYKYLVLKGGGIRGIAFVGALKVLEEKRVTQSIEKVAGTSAGAITGVLLATGYNAAQMLEILSELNIRQFNDGEMFFIGGQKRLRKNYGWYKGKKLENWIGRQIAARTGNENTTFMQLHQLALSDRNYKDIYITATNLTQQKTEIFSWKTHPDMPLKIAVRASASIPLYFGAVFMDSSGNIAAHPEEGNDYNVYADGGLAANYPITIFNSINDDELGKINPATLGLSLERPEQIAYSKNHTGIAPFRIHSFSSYVAALYNLTIEKMNKREHYEEESKHTIYISTSNLNPRVRHISSEQKRLLFNNGEVAARKFFEGK